MASSTEKPLESAVSLVYVPSKQNYYILAKSFLRCASVCIRALGARWVDMKQQDAQHTCTSTHTCEL